MAATIYQYGTLTCIYIHMMTITHLLFFHCYFLCPAYACILSEFIEVAIHLVLYVRKIYPPGYTIRD